MNKKSAKPSKKKGVTLLTIMVIFALMIALIGVVELMSYKEIKKDCSATTTGIVDYEGTGDTHKEDTVEGKYLSTGKYKKYYNKIIVKTDGRFNIETLYTGQGYGDEGDELVIYYNPDDPDEYYIDDYPSTIMGTAVTMFVLGGIMLALAVILKIFVDKKEDTEAEKERKKAEKKAKADERAKVREAKEAALNEAAYAKGYTNERIRKQRLKVISDLKLAGIIFLAAVILILISFIRTIIDMHTENPIPFNDFPKKLDDKCYSVEVTDPPQEAWKPYYDLKVGDDHILAANIENRRAIAGADEPVKLRGKIKRIRVSDEQVRRKIKEYYESIGYLDTLKDEEYAYYYLDCTKFSLWNEMKENHLIGFVFGTMFLIVGLCSVCNTGIHNAIRCFRYACSGERYSIREINDLANHPFTQWIDNLEVYATPSALIGLKKGLVVINYSDIASVKIDEEYHTEKPRAGRRRSWTTYLVIIKTKKHRKMILAETKNKDDYEALMPILNQWCSIAEYHED